MKFASALAAATAALPIIAILFGNRIIGVFPHPLTVAVYFLYWPAAVCAIGILLISLVKVFKYRRWLAPLLLSLPMTAYFSYHPEYTFNKASLATYAKWNNW